jgi:hypothetical protein
MTDLTELLERAAGSTTSEPDFTAARQRARTRDRHRRLGVATVIACGTALAVGAAVIVAGLGSSSPSVRIQPATTAPEERTISSNIEVALPDGWTRATKNILPSLLDPRLVFAAATYALEPTDHNCAQIPGNALEQLGPTDAFVWITQRSGPIEPDGSFVARPGTILPTSGDDALQGDLPLCLDQPLRGSARTLRVLTNGQALYINWAIGSEITPERLAQLATILNRFQARPIGVRPGAAKPTDCTNRGPTTIAVPDVVGMRLGPAIRTVEAAGLKVVGYGTSPSDPVDRTTRVRVSKPSAGERVPRGACIGFRTG